MTVGELNGLQQLSSQTAVFLCLTKGFRSVRFYRTDQESQYLTLPETIS